MNDRRLITIFNPKFVDHFKLTSCKKGKVSLLSVHLTFDLSRCHFTKIEMMLHIPISSEQES